MSNIISSRTYRTDRTAAIVIPTILRHDITPFIHKLDRAMLSHKVEARVYLQVDPQAKAKIDHLQFDLPHVHIALRSGGMGASIREGFRIASSSSDVLIFIPDDFDHLLRDIPSFARMVGHDNDLLLAQWDKHSSIYLPHSMWLNEAGISAAVTYAHPAHPNYVVPSVDELGLKHFKSISAHLGTWTQVYSGLVGVRSQTWPELDQQMDMLFPHSVQHLHGVGLEAGLPLAALSLNLRVEGKVVAKRYEHGIDIAPGSKEEKKFARGRRHQFMDGIAVVLEFAAGQSHTKLEELHRFSMEMARHILHAPFHKPGHPIQPSQWNNREFNTSF